MDLHKKTKHSGLPRTSRVNEKIIEYYMKFGQDRDLEKFMRLYSPSSNRSGSRNRSRSRTISNTTTASSSCGGTSDDGANFAALRRLFFLNNPECELTSDSSKSVPNSSLEQEQHSQKIEYVIPIRLEEDDEHSPKVKETCSQDLDTPKKTQRSQQTQTPDSVAKTHKRLEWDSLGDVGYIKSMSTSNISILERSLLREFFQETTTSTSNKATTNASDGDLQKKLQKELFLDDSRLKNKVASDRKLHPTPLASSTLSESKEKVINEEQAGPQSKSKERTQEQFIQTSLARPPPQQSQAVQVSIPSDTAATSSAGSCATPSSFEFCCSPLPSKEKNSGFAFSVSRQHPFVAGISELLSRRRNLGDKKIEKMEERKIQDESLVNLYRLSHSLTEALNENKENTLCTPQLDLGIQLLCSLIDAKSLSHKEKKLLVRDIVKRISRLASEVSIGRGTNSTEGMRDSPPLAAFSKGKDKLPYSLEMRELTSSSAGTEKPVERLTQRSMNLESSSSHSAEGEKLIRMEVYSTGSLPTTSAQAQKALDTRSAALKQTEKPSLPIRTSLPKKPNEINKELLIDIKSPVAAKNKSSDSNFQKNASTSTRQSMSTNSTDSLSKDLTTQKVAYQTNNSSDFDATMNEWLNPLTQSEIEYEQKKRDLIAKRQKQEKQNLHETEREVQLNWLDTEIQRLESLKNLLLNENSSISSKDEVDSKKKYATKDELQDRSTESKYKLYDSVYSAPEKSSVMSTSSEHIRQEIEVIIEESNEDVINLQTNSKRTRERRRETQTVYDKRNVEQEAETDFAIAPTGKPVFRTIKETVTTNEEQVLPIKEQKRTTQAMSAQRSKMDTPTGSNESESVCSFVQQRKTEFIEKYKNKKKSHYEALLQQQQQHHQQQQEQQQILHQHKIKASVAVAAQAGSGHYSVPNIPQRAYGFSPSAQQYQHFYPHNHMPPHCHYWHQPLATCVPPQAPPPARQCSFSASAGLTSVHSTKNNNTHSSSSIFGISSEVSIPMGSNATSSTTTTTHQYDDVAAAGVIIETSDSLVIQPSNDDIVVRTRRHSATVQVKPKSIAYVISFNTENAAKTSKTSLTSKIEEPELLTLQEHLERSKPKFCEDTKKRKAILNQIQTLRQERERELRDIVENTSLHSLDRKLMLLPPPPTKHTRVFPTKQMKAMTNKKYAGLPEILEKKQREREERRRQGNRVIRDVFNRRLQKRVRNGQLTLNHSRTVI